MSRIAIIFLLVIAYNLESQNIDGYLIDAIRYSSENKVVNTRSAGLGFSYFGIVNDLGAINYNPAGLTLNDKSEVSAGLNYNINNVNSDYLSNKSESNKNSFNITNFAISSPVINYYNPDEKYYLGVSYSNSINYEEINEIEGFNPNNSYISSESIKKREWTQMTRLSSDGVTLISDSLEQNYKLSQSGGMHELNFAIATDLGSDFSIGGSLNISFGTYYYLRFLDESDINHKYQEKKEEPPFEDLDKSYHTLSYNHNFSSIGFNIGMIYNPNKNMRFSLNITTPSDMEIKEYFYEEAEVIFDNKDQIKYDNSSTAVTTKYDVMLPWSISFGYSYNNEGLTLAGAIQFKDYNVIKYLETSDDYLLDLNNKISDNLNGNFRYGIGVEYDIPYTIFQIRGGATFETSPINRISNISAIYSGGLSLFIAEQLRLDMFGQIYNSQKDIYIYDSQFIKTQQNIYKLGIGLTYRY